MNTKIIAALMAFLLFASSVGYAESEMTRADQAICIQAHQDAQIFFGANEEILQEASCKMLELGTDSLGIHYIKTKMVRIQRKSGRIKAMAMRKPVLVNISPSFL